MRPTDEELAARLVSADPASGLDFDEGFRERVWRDVATRRAVPARRTTGACGPAAADQLRPAAGAGAGRRRWRRRQRPDQRSGLRPRRFTLPARSLCPRSRACAERGRAPAVGRGTRSAGRAAVGPANRDHDRAARAASRWDASWTAASAAWARTARSTTTGSFTRSRRSTPRTPRPARGSIAAGRLFFNVASAVGTASGTLLRPGRMRLLPSVRAGAAEDAGAPPRRQRPVPGGEQPDAHLRAARPRRREHRPTRSVGGGTSQATGRGRRAPT